MGLLENFLFRAGIGGVAMALATGPLGCFVIWRRMAYFGDATAHATVLGVALALTFGAPIWVGALVIALIVALLVTRLARRGIGNDTALGVISHGTLALGLLAASLLPGPRLDLLSLLMGDILSIRVEDVYLLWGGALAVLGWLAWRWSALLTATLNPDLARASGIDPDLEELGFTIALALVVALSIKLVGVLLIAALLILPAAAARPLAQTPERMGVIAALLGCLSVLGGLWMAVELNLQTGPAIVTVAVGLFILTGLIGQILARHNTRA